MKVPLHLNQEDCSDSANLKRLHLHQQAYHLAGGKGFRQPATNKGRKKRSTTTRMERIAAQVTGG